jgi:hypothetical protein
MRIQRLNTINLQIKSSIHLKVKYNLLSINLTFIQFEKSTLSFWLMDVAETPI